MKRQAFPSRGRTQSRCSASQYCGTLGKIGNCRVGVFLAYASPQGYAALYLPRPWLDDPVRCQQAGVPPDLPFWAKPQQALAMVECALAAGVPVAWVVGDEICGRDGALRRALETRRQAYVLAARGNEQPSRWR